MKHIGMLSLILLIIGNPLWPQKTKPLVCGIATGFPPYQYVGANGLPAGLDAEVTRLISRELGRPIIFKQSSWDDLMLNLMHKSGVVDLLCGAEITPDRQPYLDFSLPYYQRKSVLFVSASSPIQKLSDLNGQIIAGDRNSYVESYLDKNKVRLMATESKEESFKLLMDKKIAGVIAPLEVGTYICRQKGYAVRVIIQNDPGTPVAFALAKGNTNLAKQISAILTKLTKSGELTALINKYR